MFQTKVVEKIKTHILCSVTFFWKLCHLWGNVENIPELDRLQMTIWCLCTACCTPNAKNTHSEYVMVLLFHCNTGC